MKILNFLKKIEILRNFLNFDFFLLSILNFKFISFKFYNFELFFKEGEALRCKIGPTLY